MTLKFHEAATEEVAEAVAWLAKRSPRASLDLEARVALAAAVILDLPEAAPFWNGLEPFGVRKYVLQRYPYTIAYVVRGEDVIVVAVAHARRRPFYWVGRVLDDE